MEFEICYGERRVKIVHFGALGYGHNYSKEAKKNDLTPSTGIRNKKGETTKNDKWSPKLLGSQDPLSKK